MTTAIHQFTSLARRGDAVYDHCERMRHVFRDWGYRSDIYVLDPDTRGYEGVANYRAYRANPADILVYHFGIGSKLTAFLLNQPGRLVLFYQNMTPPQYLLGVDNMSYLYVRKGRRELDQLRPRLAAAIAPSRFNADDLRECHGYTDVSIAPIFQDITQGGGAPLSREKVEKWRSDKRTILFVGRLMANKRQDDLIKTLAAYTRLYGPDARLVIPGSSVNTGEYRAYLERLARSLGVAEQVVLPGFIDEGDLHALLSSASVYLSLSEHEGFGVPFLEAMRHRIPIVAYAVCAIPEVLGPAGIQLKGKDPVVTATVLRLLFEDTALAGRLVAAQDRQLLNFSRAAVEPALRAAFAPLL